MQYYMSRSIFPESFIGLAGGRNYPVTLPIADFKLRFLDSDFSAFRTRLASKSPGIPRGVRGLATYSGMTTCLRNDNFVVA
jgi:hypothetical protein